jgi:hypothetical protein
MEQPEAIARALSYGARMNGRRIVLGGMDKNVDILSQVGCLSLSKRRFTLLAMTCVWCGYSYASPQQLRCVDGIPIATKL